MKEFLSQSGVQWTEKYVDDDRGAAIEMVRRSGQTGVPVTVIGDEVVVGFDRPRLERILAARRANTPDPFESASGTAGTRKSLGAKVADAGRYALPGGTPIEGAYVGGLVVGSPAETAGLKIGDVITAVNDGPVKSVDELAKALSHLPSADVKLTLVRGATVREVMVRF